MYNIADPENPESEGLLAKKMFLPNQSSLSQMLQNRLSNSWGFQDTKNRQNSVDLDMTDEAQKLLAYEWERAQKRVLYAVKKEYKWAIDNGIAKEQARAVLPEGLTVSRMYMNGTLRSWIHYIELRASNGTQKEHMDIARACAQAIAAIFPMAADLVAQA